MLVSVSSSLNVMVGAFCKAFHTCQRTHSLAVSPYQCKQCAILISHIFFINSVLHNLEGLLTIDLISNKTDTGSCACCLWIVFDVGPGIEPLWPTHLLPTNSVNCPHHAVKLTPEHFTMCECQIEQQIRLCRPRLSPTFVIWKTAALQWRKAKWINNLYPRILREDDESANLHKLLGKVRLQWYLLYTVP